jgi:hypothetical protein
VTRLFSFEKKFKPTKEQINFIETWGSLYLTEYDISIEKDKKKIKNFFTKNF